MVGLVDDWSSHCPMLLLLCMRRRCVLSTINQLDDRRKRYDLQVNYRSMLRSCGRRFLLKGPGLAFTGNRFHTSK
jgi:hypothetical protein